MIFSELQIWGHRGWPSRFPDNVEAGLRAAAAVSDGVETDVRRCVDGRLVLSHDPVMGGLVVAETPWATLGELDLGEGHHPAQLADLADIPVPIDLEVKNIPGEPGFEPDHRIALEVAEWARPGDVVTSFWWPAVDAVHRHFPSTATGLLFTGEISWTDAVRHAVDAGHGSIAPHHGLIDEDVAQAAAREGLKMVAWTVNAAPLAARLAELGAAAIITDRPGELIAERPTTRNPR